MKFLSNLLNYYFKKSSLSFELLSYGDIELISLYNKKDKSYEFEETLNFLDSFFSVNKLYKAVANKIKKNKTELSKVSLAKLYYKGSRYYVSCMQEDIDALVILDSDKLYDEEETLRFYHNFFDVALFIKNVLDKKLLKDMSIVSNEDSLLINYKNLEFVYRVESDRLCLVNKEQEKNKEYKVIKKFLKKFNLI